jgi:hypothetical protein
MPRPTPDAFLSVGLILVACARATCSSPEAHQTFDELAERESLATASKYNAFGQHFMENCTGFDCLSMYVNHDDGMYSWTDLNISISGKDPLSLRTWTGRLRARALCLVIRTDAECDGSQNPFAALVVIVARVCGLGRRIALSQRRHAQSHLDAGHLASHPRPPPQSCRCQPQAPPTRPHTAGSFRTQATSST